MTKFNFKNFAILSLIALTMISCGKISNQATQTSTVTGTETFTNNLGLKQDMNGLYPRDLKMFDNPKLRERLKNLIGDENYAFFQKNWNVEVPIQCNEEMLIAKACKQHDCDKTKFILVYDFKKNNLAYGVRQGGQAKQFSENGYTPSAIKKDL
ncbi:MAG: inhibitor of vertebrate lysozyme family protein [Bacteroidales bacterium]|jgi:hypothetical protein|nr:inhibitor of vertebrate lysozyme family protein [Bacteroidales bacterium]